MLKCYSLRVESTIMPYSHCFLVCRINIFAHVSYANNSAMQFCNHLSCILYLLFCCALSDTDHTLGPGGFVFRSDLFANKCIQPTLIFFKKLSSPLLVPPMSCNLWNGWFCIVVHCASAAHQEGMFLLWYTSFLKESNCSVYFRSADTGLSMYHSMCKLPSNSGKTLLSYATIFLFFGIFAF